MCDSSLVPIFAPPFLVVNCEYNGNNADKINAPATPITMALSVGILNIGAIENIAIPAPNDASDLWSFNTGTESNNEFIFGTTKGATIEADNTAIIASFFKTFFDDLATSVT